MRRREDAISGAKARHIKLFNPDGSMRRVERKSSNVRRHGVGNIALAASITGVALAGIGSMNASGEPRSTDKTHTVTIDSDTPTVWNAVTEEAIASGKGEVSPEGHETATIDIRPYVDRALELNPGINPGRLQSGDQIVIPDIPNKQ